ncbi:MAG TPA: hypothetical protein VLI06_11915 [Solimonas sp.]|nr:hypothetical protein [Solimonas sp.]
MSGEWLALETLTGEQFLPLLGQAFLLELPEGPQLSMLLVESRAFGDAAPGSRRGAFALAFYCDELPRGQYLRQGTYAISHAGLGRMQLFITPTTPDARGVRYEAIFT